MAAATVDANDVNALAAAVGFGEPPAQFPTRLDELLWSGKTDPATGLQNFNALLSIDPEFCAFIVGWQYLHANTLENGDHVPVGYAMARAASFTAYDFPGTAVPFQNRYRAAIYSVFPPMWAFTQLFAPGEGWDLSDPEVALRVNRTSNAPPGEPQTYVAPALVLKGDIPDGFIPTGDMVRNPLNPEGPPVLQIAPANGTGQSIPITAVPVAAVAPSLVPPTPATVPSAQTALIALVVIGVLFFMLFLWLLFGRNR